MSRRLLSLSFLVCCLVAPLFLAEAEAQEEQSVLALVEIEGVIDPVTADYLTGRLEAVEEDDVHVVVLQIDTPGGLDISMREIVRDILESNVPVVVWVAPRGAQAASAGTFISYAATLAYMAEATEMGPPTPVNLADDAAPNDKVENDAAAFIQELASTRGRNVEWAESAVRESDSIGATEAAGIGVVDGLASSLDELLRELDGSTVEVADGSEVTIETWDETASAPSVTIRFQEMDPFEKLLHFVVDPEFAYLLLLIGLFGIIFELYNPGIGLAGILGVMSLLLGFYGLSVLPTNWAGVALIAAAVVFFIIDLQTAGLGAWTIGGSAGLVAGAMVLFSGAGPELSLSPVAIGVSLALTLIFFFSVMTAALRVRLRRPITGEEALVGAIAEAKTDIAPEGTVLTKGTLWRARTMETGIAAGSKVKVKATEGLVLLVEPLHDVQEAEGSEETSAMETGPTLPVGPTDKEA
ncbi:MAG: nodulation protein NfeD [Actinomycetota bacterium]|nr:nodulation protein NfeD [Actinomycetota bacterium]